MAIKTRTQIQTEIDNQIVSNNDRSITADIVNNIFNDINDSSINQLSDGSNFGLFEYDITKTYQIGQCVVYQNQLYKTNVLVTGGSFVKSNWTLQSPKIWSARLTGVNGSIPTILVVRDDLFGVSQPFLTYTSAGLVRFEYNQDVFSGTYSVSFDNTKRRDSQNPAFAFTNIINSTTNDIYFMSITGSNTDDYQTYYTLTVY
jgi:hypothetical protein